MILSIWVGCQKGGPTHMAGYLPGEKPPNLPST